MSRKGPVRTAPLPPAPKVRVWPKWLLYVLPAIPVAVLVWAYLPVMNAPFLFDDTNQQYALPSAALPLRGWIGPVRPMLMLSYWANVQISQTSTLSFHAVNLAIHLVTAIFAFLVIRRLL